MGDRLTPKERSELMSRIKNKNTSIEILVRKRLYSRGFRYRLNVKTLPGKPDIVLRKYHCVIFINGCFWHGHSCKDGHLPKSNVTFWGEKIARNVERDKKNVEHLAQMGWRVITIWECELANVENAINKIINQILSSEVK